jgi:hypothetical protein
MRSDGSMTAAAREVVLYLKELTGESRGWGRKGGRRKCEARPEAECRRFGGKPLLPINPPAQQALAQVDLPRCCDSHQLAPVAYSSARWSVAMAWETISQSSR